MDDGEEIHGRQTCPREAIPKKGNEVFRTENNPFRILCPREAIPKKGNEALRTENNPFLCLQK